MISVGELSTTNFVPIPVCDAIEVTLPILVIGPVKFALVVTVDVNVAVVAFPFKFAVIIPASRFPLPSLETIAFAVFATVAVVAELDTFPAVDIVASFVSTIPAAASTSPFTICS